MCLIVFAWRPEHPQPLVLAANRDEFYDRACLPLAEWPEVPGLYAGRDLLAGGTWLGVTASGRFAALTNIRDPRQPKGERSRGELPVEFLRGEANAADFLAGLLPCVEQYSGFNLLLGDRHGLFFLNSERGEVECLQPGLYGLSNADLDTPWPKGQKELFFDADVMGIEAARHGLGIALLDPFIVQDALADGSLVTPGERTVLSGKGYFLVLPPHDRHIRRIQPLVQWLQQAV